MYMFTFDLTVYVMVLITLFHEFKPTLLKEQPIFHVLVENNILIFYFRLLWLCDLNNFIILEK